MERLKFASPYVPFTVPSAPAEQPSLDFVAPYMPTAAGGTVPPDAFIDAPLGPDDMFDPATGPQAELANGIQSVAKDFGGAIANSKRAIDAGAGGTAVYPDYNLDGDRGYAWPCWDVEPRPVRPGPNLPPVAGDPLDPAVNPGGVATVMAKVLP